MKSVLIEGWRGINHSYSLVNQNQLLELLKRDIKLFHMDMPYWKENWNTNSNHSGFDEASSHAIQSIPKPTEKNQKFDITYRIDYPYRFYPTNCDKLYVFGTSEYQTIENIDYVYNNDFSNSRNNPDVKIITPSQWSKVGFLKAGFQESQIEVIPHGINPAIYKPISAEQRKQFRDKLKCKDDDFVLLSLGAMTQNKGIDKLVIAFSILKKSFPQLRLLLKDQRSLYGVAVENVVNPLIQKYPQYFNQTVLNSILFINGNLSLQDLNLLYGCIDCYVSPYRAEGFNLTPLEAAASGVPVVVTGGGATDDYFDSSFAMKISGTLVQNQNITYIEPDLESLLEQITILIENKNPQINPAKALEFIYQNFTWAICTQKLVDSFNAC
jgi:glycosyltransferase involved in cell wall biosynthesis